MQQAIQQEEEHAEASTQEKTNPKPKKNRKNKKPKKTQKLIFI